MRYLIRCHNCSHGEIAFDSISAETVCPHCGSIPGSYCVDDQEYCWLHLTPIRAEYRISRLFLFTTYVWRGNEWRFPNAKLYEAGADEEGTTAGHYCTKCQDLYEAWLAERTA
jgi:hypothetical protein